MWIVIARALRGSNLSGNFRTLLASKMEYDVGLGDTANQSTRAEVINYRKPLGVHLRKSFESYPHTLVWRDPWEIFL